jgi:hypothetical protein
MAIVLKYCELTKRMPTPWRRLGVISSPGISTPAMPPVSTIGKPLVYAAVWTPGSARTFVSTRS